MKIGLVLAMLGLGLAAMAAMNLESLRALPQGLGTSPPASADGLRKCLADGRVVYTDGACPAGSRAQAVEGGTLSVVASPPPPPPPLRDAQPDAQAVDIKQKRMDAVIGR